MADERLLTTTEDALSIIESREKARSLASQIVAAQEKIVILQQELVEIPP